MWCHLPATVSVVRNSKLISATKLILSASPFSLGYLDIFLYKRNLVKSPLRVLDPLCELPFGDDVRGQVSPKRLL